MNVVRTKFRVSMLAILVAALFGPIIVSSPAQAAGCSLGTATGASGTPGSAENPWLVATDVDFQKIGDDGCSSSGHYRQTAPITLRNAALDIVPYRSFPVDGFSGTYDGDFHTLTLAGTWSNGSENVLGVFGSNISGTIKKLHLAGDYKPSSGLVEGSPLANIIRSGGVISQVRSTVNVTVVANNQNIKLSGLVSDLGRGALMEYSSASGTLSWEPTTTPGAYTQFYGGLVADLAVDHNSFVTAAGTPRSVEIRDSYSRVTVKWPDGAQCRAFFGGIAGATSEVASDVYLVRTYSASQFHPSTNTSSEDCGAGYPAIGGLFGRSDASRWLDSAKTIPTYVYSVSSFWAKDLIGNVSNSIGLPAGGSTNQYVSDLPRAVGLTSDYLKTISTYQSKGTAGGIPDVSASLATGSSTGGYTTDGTLNTNEATFRWAIEPGNVLAFVPPSYPTPQSTPPTTAFFNRTVFSPLQNGATMLGRGRTLETATDTIPALGRVWEICSESNGGFPVLVWEERDCLGDGGGSSGGGDDSSGDGDDSSGDGDNASVKTSNQPALAATGTSPTVAVLVTLMASAMTALGLLLVGRSRKLMTGR